MDSFEEDANGTLKFSWRSREGAADRPVFYPSPSFGIDANRTFEVCKNKKPTGLLDSLRCFADLFLF